MVCVNIGRAEVEHVGLKLGDAQSELIERVEEK
jgi:hypothetical protein